MTFDSQCAFAIRSRLCLARERNVKFQREVPEAYARCASTWMTHGGGRNARKNEEQEETREREDDERRRGRGRREERNGRCHSAAHKLYEILIMTPRSSTGARFLGTTLPKRDRSRGNRRRRFVNLGPRDCRSWGPFRERDSRDFFFFLFFFCSRFSLNEPAVYRQ